MEKIKVLLVEDNPEVANLIEDIFNRAQDCEFGVFKVGCLSDALVSLSLERVDVIILDLSLPDSKGVNTVRKVRENVQTLPIIVLTGSEDEKLANEALEAGANDFIYKTQISIPGLIGLIKQAAKGENDG